VKRVFVPGAGASAFAGYPVAPDLWRFLREAESPELGAKQRCGAVITALDPIVRRYSPESDRVDLEKLFTLLDLAHLDTAPLELRVSDWR
jgi:hypothetical protein